MTGRQVGKQELRVTERIENQGVLAAQVNLLMEARCDAPATQQLQLNGSRGEEKISDGSAPIEFEEQKNMSAPFAGK